MTANVRRPMEPTSLYDDMITAKLAPHATVLSFTVVEASNATAHALRIPKGATVYAIEQLHYAGAEPLALIRNEIPAAIVTLTKEDVESRRLYKVLRSHGAAPQTASETIGARAASAAEARALNETRGAPL